jgi:hypothetical protein
MVARKRTKWRFHCSTCGVPFDGPQTWAYCSKACERERAGFGDAPPMPGYFVERHLDLARRLEVAMPWERDALRAAMTQLREEGARVAADQVAHSEFTAPPGAPTPDQPVFWTGILRREGDRFELTLRRSLAAAMKLGERLLEAREALPHGEFGRLFADHAMPVENALTFSGSWARRLMSIASCPQLTKREHAPVLPVDLQAVYVLSRAPEPVLEEAFARGAIGPALTRADARRLVVSAEGEADAPTAADEVDVIAKILDPIGARLAAFAEAHPSQFGELRARLEAVIRAVAETLQDGVGSGGTELMTSPERADMSAVTDHDQESNHG